MGKRMRVVMAGVNSQRYICPQYAVHCFLTLRSIWINTLKCVCVHSVGAFETSQNSINLTNKWGRSYCSNLQELFFVGHGPKNVHLKKCKAWFSPVCPHQYVLSLST